MYAQVARIFYMPAPDKLDWFCCQSYASKRGARILRSIGANLRKARLAANLTQEGLAEMADIHWKTLGYIESGKRDFGVTILIRLAACILPELKSGMASK